MTIIHVLDGAVGARYVTTQLTEAGFNCRSHSPNDNRARARYAPYDSLSLSFDKQGIERFIGDVLGTYRGIFLISSYAASLIADQMVDQCGQSHNIITCNVDKEVHPVVASSLSVNLYKEQRRLARIAGRLKTWDVDNEFIEADKAIRFAADYPWSENDAREVLDDRPKFLSSPSLIVAAHKLGVKRSVYYNYAGLVREFLKEHQR